MSSLSKQDWDDDHSVKTSAGCSDLVYYCMLVRKRVLLTSAVERIMGGGTLFKRCIKLIRHIRS